MPGIIAIVLKGILLKKIQREAARIETGLSRSTSLRNLYTEIGWLSLCDRRKYHKLISTFKIINGHVPNFSCQLFPSTVGNSTTYSLRNSQDIETIAHRKRNLREIVYSIINLPMEQLADGKKLNRYNHFPCLS